MTMVGSSAEQLAASLRGDIIQPGDAAYEEARKVFNGMIDKRPRLIARCADVADVIACVNFAREERLLLSVRSGGHNVAGFGTNDGGLVIDLSRMKGIRVDPKAPTVRAETGCTWGDVDHATHIFGLAAAGGVVSTTGIGGLTLGGGIGHQTRKAGLACDNIISADVVTADGQLVTASETENADLLWALRGGGGNFGVVTSFQLRLHETGIIYGGPVLWPLEMAADAMRNWALYMVKAPEELNALFGFLVVPPEEPFPEHLHNKNMCAAVVCYSGAMECAEEAVRPLVEFGPPALPGVGPVPFPMLQQAFDAVSPPGVPNYWKADNFVQLSDEVIETNVKFGADVPNILSGSIIFPIDGAAHRRRPDETAWSYRDANFAQVIYAVDEDEANMPKHTQWVRDYWSALHPSSAGGAYVNFMGEEGEDRVLASYRENYTRLAQIKRKYDPGNLFQMNQNIKPS